MAARSDPSYLFWRHEHSSAEWRRQSLISVARCAAPLTVEEARARADFEREVMRDRPARCARIRAHFGLAPDALVNPFFMLPDDPPESCR
jgi:hypothetical protein